MSVVAAGTVARTLQRFVVVRPGEGRVLGLLSLQAFTLLLAYYLIKPVREALILAQQTAEVRSYAVAAQALLLMVLIPAYTTVLRRVVPHYHLVPWITIFLGTNLLAFMMAGFAGLAIGVTFFIWLGVFNVLIVAQFWAFATDLLSVESGERLFIPIAAGAGLGAWAGAAVAGPLLPWLGPYGLMGAALALLLMTVPLVMRARDAVPPSSRARPVRADVVARPGVAEGFQRVLADPYLRLLAVFMVLLNCINATGEYLLARMVREQAQILVAQGAIASAGEWIGAFYGSYFTWINGASLLIQVLMVGPIFRHFGVGRATLIMPAVTALGYLVVLVAPALAIVRAVKIVENAVNYSLQNTARHALFLPLDEDAKYAGRTTIDTFFWRLGDLVQAGLIWIGTALLVVGPLHYAALNLAVALAWLLVASRIAAMHRRRVAAVQQDEPWRS